MSVLFKTSDFRGTVRDAMRFKDMRGTELFDALKKNLPAALEEAGVPFRSHLDEVKSGGIFGSRNPILIISYPNPPTSFFDIGFLVNDNVVSFVLLGESKQNTKMNMKQSYSNEGKFFKAAMVNPDEFIWLCLQPEIAFKFSNTYLRDPMVTDKTQNIAYEIIKNNFSLF